LATTVFNTEDIELMDGTVVTLKPLAIKPLRKFMYEWGKFAEIKGENSEDEGMDVFVACAGVALAKELKEKEKVSQTYDDKKEMTEEYKEYLEEVLDMDTIYKILEVAGGLKLNDPNLVEAAREAAMREAGTN
jgi:hypothetical protein